jgi:hypothetical protein
MCLPMPSDKLTYLISGSGEQALGMVKVNLKNKAGEE